MRSPVPLTCLLLALSACPPPVDVLTIRLPDGSTANQAAYDFGSRGAATTRTFALMNGPSSDVPLGEAQLEAGPFATNFTATTLARGGELSFTVTWTPVGDDAATLRFVDGKGTTVASLALSGHFEGAQCALPDDVDFGAFLVGEMVQRDVSFPQHDTRRDVFIGAPGSPFVFPSGAPSGTQSVGARDVLTAKVSLPARQAAETLSATWKLDPGGGCPPKDLPLHASSLEHFLTASPSTVDFGSVTAPAQPTANATLFNALSRPVVVTLELASASGGATTNFRSGLMQLEVPGATRDTSGAWRPGEADVPLTAWVLGAGTVQGKLLVQTPGARGAMESIEVPLIARAAGAGLAVRPSPVQLQVPVVGGTPLPVATGLVVVNENRAAGASSVNVTSVTLEADPGTDVAQLCVGTFDAMTTLCTLPAAFTVAPGAQKQLPLRIAPTGTGPWRWSVVLHTDDVLVPELRVDVSASPRTQGDCVLQHSQSLRFGPVRAPTPMRQALVLENQSNVACVVQGLWADGSTDVHASPSFTIAAGERRVIDVEYQPTASPGSMLQANLRFSVNATMSPTRSVALVGSSDDGCLFISPEQFDFGAVAPACGARVQSFGLGNRCSQGDVSFNTVHVSGAPSLVMEGNPVSRLPPNSFFPDALRVRFDPTANGPAIGALEFDVALGMGTRTVLVPLRGMGSSGGRQRDRFTVPSSADVLLVQDTTPSMDSLWRSLGMQAQGVVDAVTARARAVRVAAIDADVALTSFRDVGGNAWLDLELGPVQPLTSMLTPSSTSTSNEAFREPALLALTGAKITSNNTGFLRRGASLNVLVVTDAKDQSTVPASVALPQLLALKGSHRPELFTWSHVGPLAATAPSGCTYDDAVTSPGDEVLAVNATGGASLEVCAARGTPTLVMSTVLPTLLGDRDALPLRAPIEPGAMPTVSVGGVGVPELAAGGGRNWSYDVVRRSVVFSGLTLRTGEVVEFDYPTLCPAP